MTGAAASRTAATVCSTGPRWPGPPSVPARRRASTPRGLRATAVGARRGRPRGGRSPRHVGAAGAVGLAGAGSRRPRRAPAQAPCGAAACAATRRAVAGAAARSGHESAPRAAATPRRAPARSERRRQRPARRPGHDRRAPSTPPRARGRRRRRLRAARSERQPPRPGGRIAADVAPSAAGPVADRRSVHRTVVSVSGDGQPFRWRKRVS